MKANLSMMKKISFFAFFCIAFGPSQFVVGEPSAIQENEADDSLWNSKPEEIQSANVQILDKISGKVFRTNLKVNQEIKFESLKIKLIRCFKNSQDDNNEIYAYVIVQDGERIRFSNWLFASAPVINLFEHSVYDVRVEF